MRGIIVIFLAFALCLPATAEERNTHYCDDAEKWAEWVTLINNRPDDDDIRAAYALRIGLCQEVKAGTIETARAVTIFERFMDALRSKAEQEERMQNRSYKEKGI